MNNALISFILPIGKMAGKLHFLEENLVECIGLDVEVVLVHDHYDEDTCDELKALVKKFAPQIRVKLLETDSRGVSGARNLGAKFANAKWVAFVDSDDRFTPKLYIEMVLEASKRNKEIALGNFRRYDSDSKLLFRTTLIACRQRISYSRLGRNPGLWRWAFLNSRIRQCHFKPLEIGEDLDFLLQVNPHDWEIHFFDKSIYSYSINFQGQTTSNPNVIRKLPKSLDIAYETCVNSNLGMSRFNAWTLFWIQVSTIIHCKRILPLKSLAKITYWLIAASFSLRVARNE